MPHPTLPYRAFLTYLRPVRREQLIRRLRRLARKTGAEFTVEPGRGKGSHYRATWNGRRTTVQSGELGPMQIDRICRQIGVDPEEL